MVVGGFSLEDHWNQGTAQRRIAEGGWSVVVLQQGPSSLPESQVDLRAWTARFDAVIRTHGSEWHVEHMSACLRCDSSLPAVAPVAGGLTPANRAVSFGSDFDRTPATMTALPIPPLSERDLGCDFGG